MTKIKLKLFTIIVVTLLIGKSSILLSQESALNVIGNIDAYVGTYLNASQTSIHRGLTQVTKNESPTINLASLGAELGGDWGGKLIFHAGTSVDENYSSEKDKSIRYIQEANITRKLNDKLSILAGIYPGHIGLESFISVNNLAYTRSFHAEFSPYYQRGLKLAYQYSDDVKLELHAISGYQEISETRLLPAVGTLAQYGKDGDFQIAHTLYLGHRDSGTRMLNDMVIKLPLSSVFVVNFIGDIGIEDSAVVSGGTWGGIGSILEAKLTEQVSAIFRAEKFIDRERIVTGFSDKSLDMNGLSVGLNYKPWTNVFVRGEARSIIASNEIFEEDDTTASSSAFFVGSLALTF